MEYTHTLFITTYQKINDKWSLDGTYKNPDYNLEKWESYILESKYFSKRQEVAAYLKDKTLTNVLSDGNKKIVYTLKAQTQKKVTIE